MLAYDTPAGRAWYIGGSGLSGAPQYELGRRVLSHSQVLALASRRVRRGVGGCRQQSPDLTRAATAHIARPGGTGP